MAERKLRFVFSATETAKTELIDLEVEVKLTLPGEGSYDFDLEKEEEAIRLAFSKATDKLLKKPTE